MDKKITDFIVTELKIGKWLLAPIDVLLLVFAPVFGAMARSLFLYLYGGDCIS